MDNYIYETHLHTKEVSACAKLSGAEQARLYKKLGYAGIFVTDHFFGGNTCIPGNLPWKQKIELYCRGYEAALAEGKKIGLQVFFGMETNFRGTEFLLYGINQKWLLKHPEMLTWKVQDQYREIVAAGGMVVHAHPFREAEYLPEARQFPDAVDAIEGYNLGNRKNRYNELAVAYALKYKKPITGGGDAHTLESKHGGICFPRRLNSVQDYIAQIKAGTGYEILTESYSKK